MAELTLSTPDDLDTETVARALASAAHSTEQRRGADHPYSRVLGALAPAARQAATSSPVPEPSAGRAPVHIPALRDRNHPHVSLDDFRSLGLAVDVLLDPKSPDATSTL